MIRPAIQFFREAAQHPLSVPPRLGDDARLDKFQHALDLGFYFPRRLPKGSRPC